MQKTCEWFVLIGAILAFSLWMAGVPEFNPTDAPVVSPFTCFSLLLMICARMGLSYLTAFPIPLSLAFYMIVIGGNFSSMIMLMMFPTLLLSAFPALVSSSMMTSFGLICFSAYEILIIIRKTPKQALILDDLLLHFALVPGGISLLGHTLSKPFYISSSIDPRIGISYFEVALMAAYAVSAVLQNKNLFLWEFLKEKRVNVIIFGLLFINQFVAPLAVALVAGSPPDQKFGIELFVMMAGVVATLMFLILQAFLRFQKQ